MEQSHSPRTQRYPQRTPAAQPIQNMQSHRNFFDDEEEYDDVWPSRLPNSTRRYHSDVRDESGRTQADVASLSAYDGARPPLSRTASRSAIPPRRTATQTSIPAVTRRQPVVDVAALDEDDEEAILPRRSSELLPTQTIIIGRRPHWLVLVGVALLVMLFGWVLLNLVLNWWQLTQDDWRYGRPRTYQVEVAVDHNDSPSNPSHFMAINLRRHVEIIEFPGGDASHAKVYLGPVLVGDGQDLAPVTLTFKDVNGDGKLDMIVNVQNSHFVFLNDHGAFRPAHP